MITFSHEDAWILYAIPAEVEGCRLSEIIGRADYVNHAIPTTEEIASAITKGLRCGLLERGPTGVRYAHSHREAVSKVTQKPRYALDAWDALHKYLSEESWEQTNTEEFLLTDAQVETAYKEYLGWVRKRK
jgi:hypothetical protein